MYVELTRKKVVQIWVFCLSPTCVRKPKEQAIDSYIAFENVVHDVGKCAQIKNQESITFLRHNNGRNNALQPVVVDEYNFHSMPCA